MINRFLSREQESIHQLMPTVTQIHVKRPVSMRPEMLQPAVTYVGCPAAYRSGYDPEKGDALSRLIRLMKKGVEESTIEHLGCLLAVYTQRDTPILKFADFVIPVPSDPDRETQRG